MTSGISQNWRVMRRVIEHQAGIEVSHSLALSLSLSTYTIHCVPC
jgi:hypothetical protein